MADRLCPILSGTVIWFGSLEFMATGNSYDMVLLPPRTNPDAPAPQHQRRRRSDQRAWNGAGRLASAPPRR
jgi:hypothetical protein